eukprot:tig00000658_g2924.t1
MVEPNPNPAAFTIGFCDCGYNITNCLLAYCCAGELARRTRGVLEQRPTGCADCLLIGCLSSVPLSSIYTNRTMLRALYGLPQDTCNDCMLACCCPCCANMQVANEAEFRMKKDTIKIGGLKVAIGQMPMMAAPGQQMMMMAPGQPIQMMEKPPA